MEYECVGMSIETINNSHFIEEVFVSEEEAVVVKDYVATAGNNKIVNVLRE